MSMLGGCIVCYEAVISPQQSDAAFQEGVCTQMVSFWMTSVTSPLKAAAWPVLMSVIVGLIDSEVSGCKASTMDMCLARSMAGSRFDERLPGQDPPVWVCGQDLLCRRSTVMLPELVCLARALPSSGTSYPIQTC